VALVLVEPGPKMLVTESEMLFAVAVIGPASQPVSPLVMEILSAPVHVSGRLTVVINAVVTDTIIPCTFGIDSQATGAGTVAVIDPP
jgi:hypothetical protein